MAIPNREAVAQQEQKIIAIVNDTPVSAYDVAQRARLTSATTRQPVTAQLRKKITEELISESIQLQEAKKYGIVIAKSDIDRALESIAKGNNMSKQQLISALGQLGVNPRTMRRRIEAQMAWQRIVRGKFRSQVNVGASQVDAEISNQPSEEGKKTEKTEFRLQRVRLDLPKKPDQRDIARRLVEAEQLRNRINSCDQIESVIRKVSGASVKEIGRKTQDQMPQPSRALLMAVKTGQLTPANITSSGVELYAVCNKRTIQTDASQRQRVERQLEGREYEVLALRYLRDLRQEAYVEYR